MLLRGRCTVLSIFSSFLLPGYLLAGLASIALALCPPVSSKLFRNRNTLEFFLQFEFLSASDSQKLFTARLFSNLKKPSGGTSEFIAVWLSGPASRAESLWNLNKSGPAGLGREPPKFVLFRGDSNGQILKLGLIPVRFTESQ